MTDLPSSQIQQEVLRPAAAPVDTYGPPPRSGLRDFAASLSQIEPALNEFIDNRAKKFREEQAIRGEAAFQQNHQVGYAEAVRTGAIPAQASGSFVRAYKQSEGALAGQQLKDAYSQAYQAWDGKYSEDPKAFEKFFSDFVASHVNTTDPATLRGLLPHLRELQQNGFTQHTADVSKQTYNGSLDSHVAQANRDIEEANSEGLVTGKGTDYPAVFAAINERRASFVAAGGDPRDFDKSMTDAMSEKIMSTQDPALLAWFDQKIPGSDYTYGESPYGQKIKQNTIDALEVINRRQMAAESAAQTKADKEGKDRTEAAAIELLAKDPAAVLPDELIKEGQKYDGKFRVNVESWRKSLGDGFSDPKAIKEVYANILAGGGFKAVTDAAANGVFGRPEDLAAAYSFAKGYEDNKGRIEDTLGSSAAKSVLNAIDVRTKGTDTLGQPVAGTSNEGFEAQFDFKRMVQEWTVQNPNATLQEREDAIAKFGKTILDRIPMPDIQGIPGQAGGTYDQPPELQGKYNNPFSPQALPPVGTPTTTVAPPPGPDPTKLSVEQLGVLNKLAESQGVPLSTVLANSGITADMLPTPPADPKAAPKAPQGGKTPGVSEQVHQGEKPVVMGDPFTGEQYHPITLDQYSKGIDAAGPHPIDAILKALGFGGDNKGQGTDPTTTQGIKADPVAYNPATDNGQGDQRSGPTMDHSYAQNLLNSALEASRLGAAGNTSEALKGDALAAHLAELIGKHEAGGNYNAVYGNSKSTKDLSKFTLDQILAQQQEARRRGAPSTAIGRYQFLYKTLGGLKDELGLTGTEKFTPELQDRLFKQLLDRRGYEKFKAGKMSKRSFALRLSQEWASLPNPDTGRSYYAGDGLNRAGTTVGKVYAALGFTGSDTTNVSWKHPQDGSMAATGGDIYANIPASERDQFLQWNSDPVANQEQTLSTVSPDLASVVKKAQEISGVPFVVGSGKRDAGQQAKAVKWGWSKTMNSEHADGSAVDLWPLDQNGAVKFDPALQQKVVEAMQQAADELGVSLDIGASWRNPDLPHFGIKGRKA